MYNIFLIIKDLFFIFLDSLLFLFNEIQFFFFPRKQKKTDNNYLEKIVNKSDSVLTNNNPYDLHNLIKTQSLDEKNINQDIHNVPFDEISNKKSLHRGFKIGIFSFIAFVSFIIYIFWDLPNYKILENYQPPLTTRIYSADNYIISELATEKRLFVPLSHISPFVIDAFLSAEDKNFYKHSGFDYIGLLRATYKNILYYFGLSNNIEGASTISQQVVKNFLLNNDRTIRRKIREAILTMQIESAFSKDYILGLYLNEIYLGKSSYGVAMSSLNYFNKPVSDLSLAEAAFLASLPKAPSKYDPDINYDLSKSRRDWVIMRMLADSKITKKQADDALNTEIVLKNRLNIKLLKTQYATEEIRKNIIKNFGYDSIYNKGLIIKTTINYKYQEYYVYKMNILFNRLQVNKIE
jgi:penicillin-binding protein 1A